MYGKWRKKPYSPVVREEVIRMALHRHTPPGHRILSLLPFFEKEAKASTRIQTHFRMWRAMRSYQRALGAYKQQIFRRKKKGEEG